MSISVKENENSTEAVQIIPLDLRYGGMKTISTPASNNAPPVNSYIYNDVLNPALDSTQLRNKQIKYTDNLIKHVEPATPFTGTDLIKKEKSDAFQDSTLKKIEKITPPTISIPQKHILLLPTDQGAFLYDDETHTIRNIAKNLYLGDTKSVTVTSCPRVYSGLWHNGYSYIDNNGNIYVRPTGELFGFTAGSSNGCSTPVLADGVIYLADGSSTDQEIVNWQYDNINYQR